ncbi:unnamed protein product [Protopolystoma xenopodis]|uniref:EGF-like domain-containing protein n=1 Tax=Protopolystoma xenopodis TaxID=117903 RepID=A0A3S5AA51_9PLAT|nr:unnamed protein product [Protopolystoma xenopodis]
MMVMMMMMIIIIIIYALASASASLQTDAFGDNSAKYRQRMQPVALVLAIPIASPSPVRCGSWHPFAQSSVRLLVPFSPFCLHLPHHKHTSTHNGRQSSLASSWTSSFSFRPCSVELSRTGYHGSLLVHVPIDCPKQRHSIRAYFAADESHPSTVATRRRLPLGRLGNARSLPLPFSNCPEAPPICGKLECLFGKNGLFLGCTCSAQDALQTSPCANCTISRQLLRFAGTKVSRL